MRGTEPEDERAAMERTYTFADVGVVDGGHANPVAQQGTTGARRTGVHGEQGHAMAIASPGRHQGIDEHGLPNAGRAGDGHGLPTVV